MGKISPRTLTKAQEVALHTELFKALESFRQEGTLRVLEHLLTRSEKVMLARRILISKLLIGGATYSEIAQKLRVGEPTITSVDRWLSEFPDYRTTLSDAQKICREKRTAALPHSFTAMRRKYPLHFLLLNLLLDDFSLKHRRS